jgi:hypothetical protein
MPPVKEKFYGQDETLSDPGDMAVAVAKDGTPFANGACKYLRVGTGGALLRMKGKNDAAYVDWKNVKDGEYIPFRAIAIDAATNCADIVAIY